jgi:hypothetical protein
VRPRESNTIGAVIVVQRKQGKRFAERISVRNGEIRIQQNPIPHICGSAGHDDRNLASDTNVEDEVFFRGINSLRLGQLY